MMQTISSLFEQKKICVTIFTENFVLSIEIIYLWFSRHLSKTLCWHYKNWKIWLILFVGWIQLLSSCKKVTPLFPDRLNLQNSPSVFSSISTSNVGPFITRSGSTSSYNLDTCLLASNLYKFCISLISWKMGNLLVYWNPKKW